MKNKKVNSLTFLKSASSQGGIWLFLCDCGKEKELRKSEVLKEKIKSCGCKRGQYLIESKNSHGLSASPEYRAWTLMKQRCLNPTDKNYKDYGERGITICDSWINSFETFYSNIGQRPSSKHTLERKDNSKGYNKNNCKWASRKEQANNRRNRLSKDAKGLKLRSSGNYTVVFWNNILNSTECLGTFKDKEQAKTVYDNRYEEFHGTGKRPNGT